VYTSISMRSSVFHALLLSMVTLTDSYKILFYWAVDSKPETQDMIMRNVQHAKSDLQGGEDCCDVMLAHYKGTPLDWNQEWYKKHVVQNKIGAGYKFKSLKDMYQEPVYTQKWEDLYEWVWSLDSDIDFTKVDLRNLFRLARNSGSVVVSPTYTGDAAQWTAFNLLQGDERVRPAGEGDSEDADEIGHSHKINVIGKPDPRCQFRHTTYAEMTAPLLHSRALATLLTDQQCEHCIGDKAEWGFDRVWCSLSAEKLGVPKPCAYLDETPVLHLDWKAAAVNSDFPASEHEVRQWHSQEFATIKVVDCEPAVGMPPQPSNANQPGTGPAIR